MAAIDGCDRDAWQPKMAADGDTERADAKRDAEVTGDAWQPKMAAEGTPKGRTRRGTQRGTAIDGDGPEGT